MRLATLCGVVVLSQTVAQLATAGDAGQHAEHAMTPNDFWTWFGSREKAVSAAWPVPGELAEAIATQLRRIDPGLGIEFSHSNPITLAISASGDATKFDLVQRIVTAAPRFAQLRVVAFRQRGPVSEFTLRQPDGRTLSSDDIWFRLAKRGTEINLDLFVRDFPKESPGQKQEDVYLLLDNALGEFDAVKNISGIDWAPLPADPKKAGLLSLTMLPGAFDKAMGRTAKGP